MKNILLAFVIAMISCCNQKPKEQQTVVDTTVQNIKDSIQIFRNQYKLTGNWQCESPKSFDFTLYLTDKTLDTLNINYMVGYPDYLAGDSGLILGTVSNSTLLKGHSVKTVVLNTDDHELMNIIMTYFPKDSSLLWQVVNYDTTEPLSSMEPRMILKRLKE